LFHNFGVVHKSIKLTHSPNQVSQTIQERLTKGSKLASQKNAMKQDNHYLLDIVGEIGFE